MPATKKVVAKKAEKKAVRRAATPPIEFTQSLVLNQWLFRLFGLDSTDGYYPLEGGRKVPLLEAFKQRFQLNENSEEGLDENNVHHFYHALVNQITGELPGISKDELLAFDQNIVRHTLAMNEQRELRRERPVVWKYYQYLALLFVEIYLDRYFRDPQALAQALNAHIAKFNEGKEEGQQLPPLDEGRDAALGLNKLALWCATGSGKTLLMHTNLRQYQHHLAQSGRSSELNRILLLTPNEGLSDQHLKEFAAAGIEAELFDKNARGLFAGKAVEIIDIHKLADDMGDKTVAVDAFETGNLVLVDEGHRGASGGEEGKWLARRDQLCEKGFSFEYSATFKQAVKGNVPLSRRYARSIVFDYSYRYFYKDGYGKDYQILNLDDALEQSSLDRYLTACLLAAYQQRRMFDDKQAALQPFNIGRPLWIFVGGSVNAVRTENRRTVSDVTEILLFLSRFIGERAQSERAIGEILSGGLATATGQNPFANRFGYLAELGMSPTEAFADICMRLFNAPGGGLLHVEYLKGADGELALKLGDNDPFGVINVGDAKKLYDLCNETPGLVAEERDFAGSLFRRINDRDNKISLLIGSRKFTEGWNSWRVSTLGLMKIGQSEGAQIIQLFGRGVRLKGYGYSLKRSKAMRLPSGVDKPRHIELLETLNVFGIHADYMAQFKQFLEDEGLPPDQDAEEIVLPVVRNLGTNKLKVIRLKPEINGVQTSFGTAFRQLAPIPELALPQGEGDLWLLRNKVQLNWYPKIQAMKAAGLAGGDGTAALEHGKLTVRHVALLDIDRAWFELLRYKNERGWHNYNIPRSAVEALLAEGDWYDLLIPASMLAMDDFAKVMVWQEIAETLLKKYAERYYSFRKKGWEEPHLEYAELMADDLNFPEAGTGVGEEQGVYRVLVEKTEETLITQLKQLGDELRRRVSVADKKLSGGQAAVEVVSFKGHLYEPLIKASGASISVKPVALNDGEMRFVRRLKEYCAAHPEQFEGKPLFLLRNMSKGRGVGFFEAGNFYPDFIVWRIDGDKQCITFVDPKGLHNLSWEGEPKLEFYRTIREIEKRLDDPNVALQSFILSVTPAAAMRLRWPKVTDEQMAARNILFDEDEHYVDTLIRATASN
ncbi:DEAD/DEAH box helicase family protein [Pseudoxanthomonas indica]|uniref:Type III restriction enzyme, res subunit n=1 Tax=Pseudoxanthomonas indica TaxID=428993 RepID=A0A1T5JGY6_9GAMM|nr:DEAD/DEAH box helicase family protein [Pseudoxanthomonas indica]GGD58532.1 type III restriction endonuclease subunit R [Pseudoxanthomonas indica]SKC50448.1 Type III restriction enzyme, res subunit [Pseudoxanthomonas indica]